MLSFEQKIKLLESFPELQRKNVSLKRVNFHYDKSVHDKKIVAFHLHPNGNGFIYAGLLQGYETDEKGFINIRDFSEEELRDLVTKSIYSLSVQSEASSRTEDGQGEQSSHEQKWKDEEGHTLVLKFEDDLWYIYSGLSLEMVCTTREEAEHYLTDEGFSIL
ncbi:hypothetical protein [Bacillus horti]|uniref:Uncharacterized protein n=1 Tax=Caldalkalibacillus horti TaxID=77523 RepID=A0ABT9W175_9BACI|nr:hypothetical protein [Bacillus horti]MDQ0167017.1 hypothetical protein [Bacillus horti]